MENKVRLHIPFLIVLIKYSNLRILLYLTFLVKRNGKIKNVSKFRKVQSPKSPFVPFVKPEKTKIPVTGQDRIGCGILSERKACPSVYFGFTCRSLSCVYVSPSINLTFITFFSYNCSVFGFEGIRSDSFDSEC